MSRLLAQDMEGGGAEGDWRRKAVKRKPAGVGGGRISFLAALMH